MSDLDRSELIRLMVLLEMSDDYENVDQIIFPNVARDCAKLGLVVDRTEVVTALATLVENGLAAAYLLGKKTIKLDGMPEVELESDTGERQFKTYFYPTPKGREVMIWDAPGWPFDEERNVLPEYKLS